MAKPDYSEPLSAEEIQANNPAITSAEDAQSEVWRRQRGEGKLAEAIANLVALIVVVVFVVGIIVL